MCPFWWDYANDQIYNKFVQLKESAESNLEHTSREK